LDQYKIDIYQLHPQLGQLHEALERLSREQQIAFGLGCCERLYPAYTQTIAKQGLPDVIRPVLDQLWQHLEGVPKSVEELRALQGHADWVDGPSYEDTSDQEYVAAYNCLGAMYRTVCSCLENTVDNVVRAWTCCEDVVYQFLRDRLLDGFVDSDGLLTHEKIGEMQAIILPDPLMLREYEFARRLVRWLSDYPTITRKVQDAVTTMAQADAALPQGG
jgi:hypothetical protein